MTVDQILQQVKDYYTMSQKDFAQKYPEPIAGPPLTKPWDEAFLKAAADEPGQFVPPFAPGGARGSHPWNK